MEAKLFSLNLTVAEVLRQWPETVPVFLAYKLGCVGCSMAEFETLSDAMQVYSLPGQFLDDLNDTITKYGDER